MSVSFKQCHTLVRPTGYKKKIGQFRGWSFEQIFIDFIDFRSKKCTYHTIDERFVNL